MFNTEIEQINKIIKRDDNVVGIAIVGSYNNKENFNDIDFLIVTKNLKRSITFLKEKFKPFKLYINDDSLRIVNYIDREVGLALYQENELRKMIVNIVNGHNIEPIYKNWNIVGWLPECLLCDINDMKILYEKNMILTEFKSMINPYPIKLKKEIIKQCDIKLSNLEKRRIKAKSIERNIIDSEIISLKIRKKFSQNELYYRGFKDIDETLKKEHIHYE